MYESLNNLIEKARTKEENKKYKANSSSNISIADELLKFKSLLDMGVITEEEFKKKKDELLNS